VWRGYISWFQRSHSVQNSLDSDREPLSPKLSVMLDNSDYWKGHSFHKQKKLSYMLHSFMWVLSALWLYSIEQSLFYMIVTHITKDRKCYYHLSPSIPPSHSLLFTTIQPISPFALLRTHTMLLISLLKKTDYQNWTKSHRNNLISAKWRPSPLVVPANVLFLM
jgi:hypothetical protein